METKRTVKFEKSLGLFDLTQYVLALFIAILFAAGLFGFFKEVGMYLLYAIVVQVIFSLVRLKVLHMLLELILVVLAILSLGLNKIHLIIAYPFIFIGLLAAILDVSTFKYVKIYKMVETRTFDQFGKKKKVVKKKKKVNNVQDAEFKEK